MSLSPEHPCNGCLRGNRNRDLPRVTWRKIIGSAATTATEAADRSRRRSHAATSHTRQCREHRRMMSFLSLFCWDSSAGGCDELCRGLKGSRVPLFIYRSVIVAVITHVAQVPVDPNRTKSRCPMVRFAQECYSAIALIAQNWMLPTFDVTDKLTLWTCLQNSSVETDSFSWKWSGSHCQRWSSDQ